MNVELILMQIRISFNRLSGFVTEYLNENSSVERESSDEF